MRIGLHVTTLDQFDRGQEFVSEIILPPPDTGERRGRTQHRALTHHGRVFRLDAPDRRDHIAIDAVLAFHRIEGRAIFGEHSAPARDALLAHQNVEIVPERLVNSG